MNKTFDDLNPSQKSQAGSLFPTAGPSDGYVYALLGNKVIARFIPSRKTMQEVEQPALNPILCDKCRDTGEKVIFDDRIVDGYGIVFCDCIHGRKLAAVQTNSGSSQ